MSNEIRITGINIMLTNGYVISGEVGYAPRLIDKDGKEIAKYCQLILKEVVVSVYGTMPIVKIVYENGHAEKFTGLPYSIYIA